MLNRCNKLPLWQPGRQIRPGMQPHAIEKSVGETFVGKADEFCPICEAPNERQEDERCNAEEPSGATHSLSILDRILRCNTLRRRGIGAALFMVSVSTVTLTGVAVAVALGTALHATSPPTGTLILVGFLRLMPSPTSEIDAFRSL
jgi:hypothetical protein